MHLDSPEFTPRHRIPGVDFDCLAESLLRRVQLAFFQVLHALVVFLPGAGRRQCTGGADRESLHLAETMQDDGADVGVPEIIQLAGEFNRLRTEACQNRPKFALPHITGSRALVGAIRAAPRDVRFVGQSDYLPGLVAQVETETSA